MTDTEIAYKTFEAIWDAMRAIFGTLELLEDGTCEVTLDAAAMDFASDLAAAVILRWEKRKRRGRVPWQVGRRQSVGGRENSWRKKRRDRLPFYRRLVKALENCDVQIGLEGGACVNN